MSNCFAIAFSILGSFLLFVSNQPTTIGSVVMVAAISAAISSAFGDAELIMSKEKVLGFCGADVENSHVSFVSVAKLCAFRVLEYFHVIDLDKDYL
jgi:hypothetical protein